MSLEGSPWLRNAYSDTEYKRTSWVMAVLIVIFITLGTWALLDGATSVAMIFFFFAVLTPIVLVVGVDLLARFWIPAFVKVLDDGALLFYSEQRTKRIVWKEVRAPVEVRRYEDFFLNKIGESILFKTDRGRLRLLVDGRIGEALRRSYEDWCGDFGHVGRVIDGKRFPLDQIIAGEGSKARGYIYFISGAVAASMVPILIHVFVGFSHVAFTASIFVMTLSWLGLCVFYGLAEIRSEAKYVKHALLALFGPLWSLVVILTISTMDVLFLAALVLLLLGTMMAYVQVWRKVSKAGGDISRG